MAGEGASYIVNIFRILIDDVSETRFTDIQITSILNTAELDVINELRTYGWLVEQIAHLDLTILAGTQEIDTAITGPILGLYMVRKNETDDTSIVPIMEKYAALQSRYPACYHEDVSGGTGNVLGYYKKVSSDMKFTISFLQGRQGDFDRTTYSGADITDQLPASYVNLILYKSLGLAAGTDRDRASIFDLRYREAINSIRELVLPQLRQVVDVYGTYGNN